MYPMLATLPPERSPEEHEAALLQLARGLIGAAGAWREGMTTTLTDPTGLVRNINAALAGLNAYVGRQHELRTFDLKKSRRFRGYDVVISIFAFLKGLFLR